MQQVNKTERAWKKKNWLQNKKSSCSWIVYNIVESPDLFSKDHVISHVSQEIIIIIFNFKSENDMKGREKNI